MNNSLQISTKIEDMLEEIESKRVSYQTMYECIQTKIVSKVTSLADQIRNETLQWYERIQQEQLKLLDQTDKFEDELTERLEQLNVKHLEIEAKIKKYDYIFNNVQLNDNKMNQVKRKLKRSKRRFDEAIEELNAFNLDDIVIHLNQSFFFLIIIILIDYNRTF
jgi:DNA integrity scanning protein DisA with diadenylate cyclase activity